MTEASLEQVVEERQFAGLLQTNAEVLFRLANTLNSRADVVWNKRHFFQLMQEADGLESFLDDYGARQNRTYHFFTELVACTRWFAQAGYSMAHLGLRMESYGVDSRMDRDQQEAFRRSHGQVQAFVRESLGSLLGAIFAEARDLGIEITPETFPEELFVPVHSRKRLPRNVDQEEPKDERQKIAETVSRFIQASEMLAALKIRQIDDAVARSRFLAEICAEEQARVYEATVHNLQSTYDTYIKNTVLESKDPRLIELRGHASAALHLLQANTYLTHFYERHESDARSENAKKRIARLVERTGVQEMTLNHLLTWAARLMINGRALAGDLLPAYTNALELEVELSGDVVLHARPASLIVGIVNHYGTPVELEIGGQRCNAASILELLVTVGSHPDQRKFTIRGDENPLRDISLLFQYGLGESGIDRLPDELDYLRG